MRRSRRAVLVEDVLAGGGGAAGIKRRPVSTQPYLTVLMALRVCADVCLCARDHYIGRMLVSFSVIYQFEESTLPRAVPRRWEADPGRDDTRLETFRHDRGADNCNLFLWHLF